MKREALQRLVVEATYKSTMGGWCSNEVMGTFGVGVWKHIRRGWDKFSKLIHFDVGVGSKVIFWHDIWCGDTPLKLSYFALFSIAWPKDVCVADNMHVQYGIIQLNVIFTRPIQDWLMELVLSSFEVVFFLNTTWRG